MPLATILATAAHLASSFLGLHVGGQVTAGDIIVGGSTLALAAFAYMSVRVARRTLEAQDAPLIVPEDVHRGSKLESVVGTDVFTKEAFSGVLPDGRGLRFALRVQNVGRGPAVVKDVRLVLNGRETLDATYSHRFIRAGTFDDFGWVNFDLDELVIKTAAAGTLTIYYAHANRSILKTTSRVRLHKGRLYVDTIDQTRKGWRESVRPPDPDQW
jgi:hypothetical protein